VSGKKLVIVESPAKAKTIGQYLGSDYEVLASVGHIRDIPKPSELPPEMKKGPFGEFAVDVDHGFVPYYAISPKSAKTVADLKRALKGADELFLATDEDREGEAIAWHLLEVLQPKVPVKRMVFHEITKEAIAKAKESTRDIDTALVDAQETRRIMDRLFGWKASDVVRRKVGQAAQSAGRVQSPAVRLVVEREWERIRFRTAEYWDLLATLDPGFSAELARLAGERIAGGKDFDDRGQLVKHARVLDEAEAGRLADALRAPGTEFEVVSVESKPFSARPGKPFTTSSLQQEAGRKLKWTSKHVMDVAQSLYQNGYITYMRTDSVALSSQAVTAARAQATALYGPGTVPDKPRIYVSTSKNAQEAHEAIRPSGESFRTPASLSSELRGDEFRLYELIWKRTVASQMIDATKSTTTITLSVDAAGEAAEFTSSGTVVLVAGFLQAYEETRDGDDPDADDAELRLPDVAVGARLAVREIEPKGHSTKSPARYTEASLVAKLEELGIGRPSTYASTIQTIQNRGYVRKLGQALVPEWVAFPLVALLEDGFGEFVSYRYTAELEEDLDRVARGELDRVEWLKKFYFGEDGQEGLVDAINVALETVDPRVLNGLAITDKITVRVGKYGPFLSVDEGGEKPRAVNIPPDITPDQLTIAKAVELAEAPVIGDRVLGVDPESGHEIVVKDGRFGPYVSEVLPAELTTTKSGNKKAGAPKPRTGSLFKDMEVSTIDLETALRLLSLPRTVGADPETGETITAQNGPYGPYLKKGTDSRSIDSEGQIFEITLEEALEVYSQPKQFGRRTTSSALAEFGPDPVSGKPIKLKDGRFGPYVTDGETNATIPRGEDLASIDEARAIELIQARRDRGPAAPRGRAPAKTASKATGKTAAKTPAKPAAKTAAKPGSRAKAR
jgi:DNA topoisomerase-1